MKPMWEIKQRAEANGVLELYVYGDVTGDYFDFDKWEAVESETSADHFRQELAKYPDVTEIDVYINSLGGSVFEGTAIYNQLKRHPARKIVKIDGFACSIASVIAMAGDEVIMPRNALMMVHNMWQTVTGNAAELRKAADSLDTINAAGRQAYLEKSGGKISEDVLVALMDNETWLTAEECIAYGFADRFADDDVDMSQAADVLQKANIGMQRRIDLQKSMAAQLRQLTEAPATQRNKLKKMFS